MDVEALINDLDRLARSQSELNRLTAQIPYATGKEREAIAQRLAELQREVDGKVVESDRED